MKYRKKPVVIEAVQFKKDNIKEVLAFLGSIPSIDYVPECGIGRLKFSDYCCDCISEGIDINTLEGTMKAMVGDYIIKGICGEFYPCKEDIFIETYDRIE